MSQLDLEWTEAHDRVRCGTATGVLAWCGCGWRSFSGAYTRKGNEAEANRRLVAHRKRCPWLEVEG